MATATKCMSKMLKKELYEYCKTLIKENQKLQLFNNSQEEEIEKYQSLANNYADETQTNGYGDYIGSVETLEKYIEELQEKIKTQKYNCLIKYETDIKQKDICIEKYQLKNQALEKDLEYFQNKCEIMEKELIKEDDFSLTYEEGNMPIVVNEHGKSIGELQEDGEVIMYSEEED